MSGEGIVAAIVMLAVGVAWLAQPYLRQGKINRTAEREIVRERLNLVAAYERAIVTVRELDEDYQVGKLSEEAYQAERAQWTERGAVILAALDNVNGDSAKSKNRSAKRPPEDVPPQHDDAVEEAIAAYFRAREQAEHR